MAERILFLTGRLAEKQLERVLESMQPTDFAYRVKQIGIALVLHVGEFRENLKAASKVGMLCDPDVEAALTVHETCYPFGVKLH